MKTATRLFLILFALIAFGCSSKWGRSIIGDEVVWRSIKFPRMEKNSITFEVEASCFPKAELPPSVGQVSGVTYFQFDSVRIYLDESVNISNIIESGLLTGQMFFYDTINPCSYMRWDNPVLSEYEGWTGYNLFVSEVHELKTTKIPKKLSKRLSSYRLFEMVFRYQNQPYINPSEFILELENSNLKFADDTLELDQFLKGAEITSFYRSAIQI